MKALADIVDRFIEDMAKSGICPIGKTSIKPDGSIHRFRVQGDKPGRASGWAILFANGLPAGAYGSHRLKTKIKWCMRDKNSLSKEERAQFAKKMVAVKEQRALEVEREYELARLQVQREWAACEGAMHTHRYLRTKKVGTHGLKVDRRGKLVVPLRDADGKLWSLQTIDACGDKLNFTNARKKGCFHLLGPKPSYRIVIAEGFATAATIAERVNVAVAMACDASNLTPVAEAIRKKYPLIEIVVAADDDHKLVREGQENRGMIEAFKAAKAVNGRVAIPVFDRSKDGDASDFNDLVAIYDDAQIVIRAIATAETVPAAEACCGDAMLLSRFLRQKLPKKELLVGPWLRQGELAMVHGWRGVGKSLLRDALAAHLACGRDFIGWRIEKPASVLVVDGEMPQADVQARLRSAIRSAGGKQVAPFRVLTADCLEGGSIDLTKPSWQEFVERQAGGSQVIFLDNVATLAGDMADMNEAKSWSSIQEWTKRMRSRGHSIVWFHNDGKGRAQLGTATREIILNAVLHLTPASGPPPSNGSKFSLSYSKARDFFGNEKKSFKVKVTVCDDGRHVWTRYIGASDNGTANCEKAAELLRQGLSYSKIAAQMSLTKSTVQKLIEKSRKK